jgi:hypothetical protein
MRRLPYRSLGILVWLMIALPAWASANVSCRIDDAVLNFELEAIAGRTGPITQVQVGKLKIKEAAAVKLQSPKITFDRSHIIQQWDLSDDLRLQIEVNDDAAHESVNLVILANRFKSRDKYSGRYVLKILAGGETKKFNGRIRQCEAG